MPQQFLLSGPVGSPRRRTSAGLVFFWLFTFAALGAYFVHHQKTISAEAGTAQAAASKEAPAREPSEEQLEDVADRLRNVRAELLKTTENAKRAQTRVRQVGRGLQQDYLEVYRQRLEIADQNCELALRSATRALEELEFAQANLTKRRSSR